MSHTQSTRPRQPATRRQQTLRARLGWLVSFVVLIVGALVVFTPFVFMVSTSFNGQARTSVPFPPQIIPEDFSLAAYEIATSGINIDRLYWNTFQVAFVEIAFSLGSALLSGYALSKIKPKGAQIILLLALSTMMIPVEATILPNFMTFQRANMLDTYWPLWLPAIAYPFGTFLVKQYLDTLPSELREAAKVDGAGELRILWLIYLPLCKGVIATLTILLFLSTWNSYLWPLIVINDPDKYTIQLGIAAFNQSLGDENYALPDVNMAATLLSLIPVLAIYLFFQRYIVQSVASSAIKG